jgi:hypothetical protein
VVVRRCLARATRVIVAIYKNEEAPIFHRPMTGFSPISNEALPALETALADPLAVSEESGLRLKASVEPGPTVPVPSAQCIYACFEGRWIEVCRCPRGHVT